MKYRYGLLLASAAVGGVYLSLSYVNPYSGRIPLSEMILQLSGSRGNFVLEFSYYELIAFVMRLLPTFIFELYAGIMLYRHFCTASIYVFSRYPHRVKWYIKEACSLGGTVGIFNMLLLLASIVTTAIRYELQIDCAGMILLAYHFFIYTLWVYIMTLSVNLIALYSGSSTAYMMVIGMQMACTVFLNLIGMIVRGFPDRLSYDMFLVWNPVAHLVLGWHDSKMDMVSQVLFSSYMQTDLNDSLLLLFLLAAAATFAGAVIIKKQDLLVSDLETGGI